MNMEKKIYTLDNLLNDILTFPDEENSDAKNDNNARREHQAKLVVIQMLIELVLSYKSDDYDDQKLINAIENKVRTDELLSGYMFFVSQKPQFDFSWNYMRKCEKGYIDFLVNVVRFLKNMIQDINMLAGKECADNDIHVIFDGYFDVTSVCEQPFVKVTVLWDKFRLITSSSNEYRICVKKKDVVIKTGKRKKASDAISIFDASLKIINNSAMDSE